MNNKIRHLIVLMLENRSFDHMLGFLQHPDHRFRGLTGDEANLWAPGAQPARVSTGASYLTTVDPGHGHENVLRQLTGLPELHEQPLINNSGFAYDYSLVSVKEGFPPQHGAEVMKCFAPERVPVLSTLAKEFAVCDHWFCSVPGETWPNRNFAVAATSDGTVSIELGLYWNKTIFELIQDAGREWRIYHDGIPQLWAFPKLWARFRRRWFDAVGNLVSAIATDTLPELAFIEPDHFGRDSNSQHPHNNIPSGRDFLEGEALIRNIYTSLRSHPEVFQKTLFLITYDEHGGYYDHEPPPRHERFMDGQQYRKDDYRFRFDLLGPRVPAVLVSPWIPAGTIVSKDLDHSSIVATSRALFAPTAEPLTDRDRYSETFLDACSLQQPRSSGEMPDLPSPSVPPTWEAVAQEASLATSLDQFQQSLLWVAGNTERAVVREMGGQKAAALSAHGWGMTRRLNVDTVAGADDYQDFVVRLFRETATE